MRKVIAVVVLIGLGVLIYLNPSIYNRNRQNEIDLLADDIIEEEELISLARADEGSMLNFSVEELQRTPDQIVTFNAMVMKVMYRFGDNVNPLTEEEIGLLVDIQRKYYHEDLLAINDREFHILTAVKEVERAHEGEDWIVDYVVEAPVYDSTNSDVAVVDVTFIPNSLGESTDIHQRYLVERMAGLWYIKGWKGIESVIVE